MVSRVRLERAICLNLERQQSAPKNLSCFPLQILSAVSVGIRLDSKGRDDAKRRLVYKNENHFNS